MHILGPKSASSAFSSTSVRFIRHLALTLAVKVEFANDSHSSSNLTIEEMDDKVVDYHEESQAERLSRKTKESPFMIVGLLGLTVACGIGAYQYKNRGRMRTSIYLMRLRVIAQGTVVGTLALGATYSVGSRLLERYNKSH